MENTQNGIGLQIFSKRLRIVGAIGKMDSCREALEEVMEAEGGITFCDNPLNSIPSEKDQQAYKDVIGEPVYLYKIRDQIDSGELVTPEEVFLQVKQCFENAKKFCRRRFPAVYEEAQVLWKFFKDAYLQEGLPLPGGKTQTEKTYQVAVEEPKPQPTRGKVMIFTHTLLRAL